MTKLLSTIPWTLLGCSFLWAAASGDSPKPAPSRPPIFKDRRPKPPMAAQWDLKALEENYTILGRRYEPTTHRMVWQLRAKRKVARGGLQARFLDGNQAEWARAEVTLVPRQAEYDKGARLEAVLSLPAKEVCRQTTRVVVRPVNDQNANASGPPAGASSAGGSK